MKKLTTILFFCLISFLGYSQDEIERVYLYKSNGEYFIRVEIPYEHELAAERNRIIVEVHGHQIYHETNLTSMPQRQTQNEFSDYVAVYDFPIGKKHLFRFKKLKCKVSFDYQEMDEFFSLEFRKFMWF